MLDGPFTETKELIAGFWLWQVDSMADAIQWVKRCPNPMLEESDIEIRPLYEAADFGDAYTPELREQAAVSLATTVGLPQLCRIGTGSGFRSRRDPPGNANTTEPLAKLRRVETGVSVSRDSALSKCAIPLNFVGFEDHEAGRDGFSHPSDKPVAFSSAIMRRVDGSRSNIRRYVTRRSSCRAVKPSTPNIRWHITLSAPRTRTVRPPWLSFTPPLTRSAVLRSP